MDAQLTTTKAPPTPAGGNRPARSDAANQSPPRTQPIPIPQRRKNPQHISAGIMDPHDLLPSSMPAREDRTVGTGRRVHFADDLPHKEGSSSQSLRQVQHGGTGQRHRSPAPPRHRTTESHDGEALEEALEDNDGPAETNQQHAEQSGQVQANQPGHPNINRVMGLDQILHHQDRHSRAQKAALRQLEKEGAKTRIPVCFKRDGPTWGFEPTERGRGPDAGLGEPLVPVYFERRQDPTRSRRGGNH